MSYQDYTVSKKISLFASDLDDDPFYALLMASFRFADSENLERLVFSFPDIYSEFKARYNASYGVLETDYPKLNLCEVKKWD